MAETQSVDFIDSIVCVYRAVHLLIFIQIFLVGSVKLFFISARFE